MHSYLHLIVQKFCFIAIYQRVRLDKKEPHPDSPYPILSVRISPMRHILTSVVLVVLLFPSLASGETVKWGDLIVREDLHYK